MNRGVVSEAMHGAIDCVAGSGIRTPQPVLSTEGRMYTLHSFQTADGNQIFWNVR